MESTAASELLASTRGIAIKAADIRLGHCEEISAHQLKIDHTPEELSIFLKSLEFEYDSGFGTQHLFGTVWLANDTWLDRGEYDGSEWWNHQVMPEIPTHLL